jgi:Domain of unknown function (DUF4190)/GYF domain 2
MYKIIGADGREYGPVTAEQLRRWIAEGRANAQTRVLAEGSLEWKPLGTLVEFAGPFAPAAIPALSAGIVRKTNGFATSGMIFGILSWTFCCCYGVPLNILGIIFSAIALSQINRHPEVYEGRGLAIAGLAISIASLVICGMALIWRAATGNVHFNWNNQFGQ